MKKKKERKVFREMLKIIWVIVWVLSIVCIRSEPLLPSIASKQNKVIFIYPIGVQSERDLFVCPNNSACNVIHKRFWLPPIVERLCRCPQRHECTWTWSDNPDSKTMSLDNRSQIKFCSDLSELPKCEPKKSAARVTIQTTDRLNVTLNVKNQNSHKNDRRTEPKNVTVSCNCEDPHYWKLKVNSTKYDESADHMQLNYYCSKLKKCSRLDFCGYVRTDTFSTFYRCSCPKGHMCITRDKSTFKAEEFLFNGYAYKAFCYPVK